jgi:hypothetical protein
MKTVRCLGFAFAWVIILTGCAVPSQTPTSQPTVEGQKVELFEGTVYISPDVLTPESPTDFLAITARGTMVRETFDRRANDWVEEEMHVYTASYQCSFEVDVLVNLEFPESEAKNLAEGYARVLGQLPIAARSQVYELWIHAGDFPAGGGNQSILIHTDLAERDHDYIEEIFIHESAHTSLDWQFGGLIRESDWIAASALDAGFVSSYAEQFPDREDVAESFGAYALWLQATGKPGLKADAQRIEDLMPERLDFFDQMGKQLRFESGSCMS